MIHTDYGQDDLTKVLLERMPKEADPKMTLLEPPVWGKRTPPVTHRFGYKGGGMMGKMLDY